MITDKSLEIADNLEVENGQIGDVIDLKKGFGVYKDVFVTAKVNEKLEGGTSLRIIIETSDEEDFGDTVEVLRGPTIDATELEKGAILLKSRLPFGIKRYVRAFADVAGTFSAGKISISMSLDADKGIDE